MKVMILDTETTSTSKPYCYNIGYIIYDTQTEQVVVKREFVVEQVWHNQPLFASAYYAEKRPLYVSAMRGRRAKLEKYGNIQKQMTRDIKYHDVQGVYAFNSAFDDGVFEFNANVYGCRNAIDSVPVFDIRGYAVEYLMTQGYKEFCNSNECDKLITPADGFRTTAESFYCFLTQNVDFNEEHTALADCEIELEILKECIKRGATWQTEYMVARSYPRNIPKVMQLKDTDGTTYEFNYKRKIERQTDTGVVVTLK